MATITDLFEISTITNMHVGSGGENYGIIDKSVQRDATTNYPYIAASSLKGALREFFEEVIFPAKSNDVFVRHIFGSNPKETGDVNQGAYRFFSAQLLSIPARSSLQPYYNASSKNVLKEFLSFCKAIQANADLKDLTELVQSLPDKSFTLETVNVVVEGYALTEKSSLEESKRTLLKRFVGDHPVVFDNSTFRSITDQLPVLARNQLESGISKNLWYEEVVPSQSRFYFAVMRPENDPNYTEFVKAIERQPVQIGANATIGYGYVNIKKMML